MEPGAPGASQQSNRPVIDLQQSTSQVKLADNDGRHQQKQQIMHGRHQQRWDNHLSRQEEFEQNQPKHPEQRQQHVDEQMVDVGTSAESNSFVLHLQQFTSQPQGENQSDWPKDNKHEQHQDQKKRQLKGELEQQKNQLEDHSNKQELFQQSQAQHPEQGQPHFDEQSDHLWPETLQVQQQQHKEEHEQHQHEEKQQYMQQSLQTHQQQQKEEQEQHQHEEKQQHMQQPLQTHQRQQKEEQEQHQHEENQQYMQQSLETHQQQQKEDQEQHQHEEKQQYMQQLLQTHQQQQKEEQEQPQHEEKQQSHQQPLQSHQQQQKEEQEQHQHEDKWQYLQEPLQTHQQQQKKEEDQHQHEEKQQYMQQSLQTRQKQQKEEEEQHEHEEKQQYVQQSLQTCQKQQKEEQEQHEHEDKQQYMQQPLQTHQQIQQQQLQPQVQQQPFNHQQSLQAASGQNTSRPISFSYLVEMILPHLPREQAEWVSARLSEFKRNEITKDDFVGGTRKVVGDHILVQTVKQIQKKETLATSSTATLHHTLSAFGGPISGGHSSGNLLQGQMCIQMPSLPPSSAVGSEINTSAKVPLFGQNNSYEATCPLNHQPRKKQKVSGDYLDQRIDPLNDVTAFSGINIREEEDNLFSGSKNESCVAETMRNAVQEKEENFLIEKGPLRAKIAGIMEKYGIKYISPDSEHCLSLCVEEHLRAVVGQLIRLSKQRVDLERASHKVVQTSDVQHQILALNKKVNVDLEKKQAEEEEKLQKLYRKSMTENNASTEVEKDECHAKSQRACKEYNGMRSNAANAAVRAAIGGDDMLLKWQWMAEQAQQKHKGAMYQAFNACTNRDASKKNIAGRLEAGNVLDHLDASSTGMIQNLGRKYPCSRWTRTEPFCTICIKDVIALLEQMSDMTKSTLLCRLYERDAECNNEKPFGNQSNDDTSK